MTLHSTIRSVLQRLLDWTKERRDHYGAIRDNYRLKYNAEKKFQKIVKERKEKQNRGEI
jgi:hypothetical protein